MMSTSLAIAWGPATSVGYGASPTLFGYLKGATTVGLEGETAWADVDQEITPVDAKYTKKQLVAKFVLAEVTPTLLGIGWDVSAAALDAGVAVPNVQKITIKTESSDTTNIVRTWTLQNGVSCDFGEVNYEKGNIVLLPVTFRFLKVTSASASTCADGLT
jgi:hypothetical protein